MAQHIWLIPALPLAACLLIGAFCLRDRQKWAPAFLILALAGSLALSVTALHAKPWLGGLGSGTDEWSAAPSPEWRLTWLSIELAVPRLAIEVGTLLDPLSAVMLVVVSLVALLIQIFSIGYMHGDSGYGRYFAYMGLFSFSMLGLVASNNLLLTYIFWELVGICSYLLIGFWYRKPEAAQAAKKAFVVTRFGDVGFLLGVLALSKSAGTFNFIELHTIIAQHALIPFFFGQSVFVTVVALLIFSGAVGKSAQFPLHVWLPDAMEGPTPVSALIHAATMVAAGVYLVARTYFIFKAAPVALVTVACIGGFTAFMAATMATAQNDIKRVLAYSTISQLGYMMLGLGAGSALAGIFHLTTHAFFKALLFLCAGSVIHAVHSNDLYHMGGLGRAMKITAATTAVGGLALAGIWPFSGFFSKDAILASVMGSQSLAAGIGEPGRLALFGLALLTVLLTGYYTTRMWLLAFTGAPRENPLCDLEHKPHESPAVMTVPLIILAGFALCAGWFGGPVRWFFGGGHGAESLLVTALATGCALLGIIAGWVRFRPAVAPRTAPAWAGLGRFFADKWYIDAAYQWFATHVILGASLLFAWVDRHVVNGFVDGVAWFTGRVGVAIRRTETGQLQFYALIIFAAAVIAGVVLAAFAAGGP